MHNQTPGPGHDVPYPASGTNERAKPSSPPHAGKSFWIRDYGNYTANPDLAAEVGDVVGSCYGVGILRMKGDEVLRVRRSE